MTWRLLLITVGVVIAVEALARLVPGGDAWANGIAVTLVFIAAGVIIVRRYRHDD